jgi:hypothetical protein
MFLGNLIAIKVKKQGKAVPPRGMDALGRRGGITPTASSGDRTPVFQSVDRQYTD